MTKRRTTIGLALACAMAGCTANPGVSERVEIDPELQGAIEVVSIDQQQPGKNNRLEVDLGLRNVSDRPQRVKWALTWLDARGGQQGGQDQTVDIAPGQVARLQAPTNSPRVASFFVQLQPGAEAARPATSRSDTPGIAVLAAAVGETGYGTLALNAVSSTAAEVVWTATIPKSDCATFSFYPGGRCTASGTTPRGATSSVMIAYRAVDTRSRSGRLEVGFSESAPETVAVSLSGAVGDGPKGSLRIDLP